MEKHTEIIKSNACCLLSPAAISCLTKSSVMSILLVPIPDHLCLALSVVPPDFRPATIDRRAFSATGIGETVQHMFLHGRTPKCPKTVDMFLPGIGRTGMRYVLVISFSRATRYKETYRSVYVGTQNDEPLWILPIQSHVGGGFKGVHRFIVSNLRDRQRSLL